MYITLYLDVSLDKVLFFSFSFGRLFGPSPLGRSFGAFVFYIVNILFCPWITAGGNTWKGKRTRLLFGNDFTRAHSDCVSQKENQSNHKNQSERRMISQTANENFQ